MTVTYDAIASTTLTTGANTITFNSIPGTFTDLRLVFIGTVATSGQDLYTFNGNNPSSGTLYSETWLSGDGSSANTSRTTNFSHFKLTRTSNLSTTIPMLHTYDVFSYAGSTNKTVLGTSSDDQNGSGGVVRSVGLYRNTSAITSITITCSGGGNFATGTTATLYGIKAE